MEFKTPNERKQILRKGVCLKCGTIVQRIRGSKRSRVMYREFTITGLCESCGLDVINEVFG